MCLNKSVFLFYLDGAMPAVSPGLVLSYASHLLVLKLYLVTMLTYSYSGKNNNISPNEPNLNLNL